MLSLHWTDPGSDASDTADDADIAVSYVVLVESGETLLVRRLCKAGAEDSTIMAHLLDPLTPPTVLCAPDPCGPTTTSANISVTACVLAPSGECRPDEDYVFSVSGTRRVT